MYRARDRLEHERWLDLLAAAADDLDLDEETAGTAVDLFLTAMPAGDQSKPAIAAASLYAATLVVGEERPQGTVADAVGVSRPSVQTRWKGLLAAAGFDVPDW